MRLLLDVLYIQAGGLVFGGFRPGIGCIRYNNPNHATPFTIYVLSLFRARFYRFFEFKKKRTRAEIRNFRRPPNLKRGENSRLSAL